MIKKIKKIAYFGYADTKLDGPLYKEAFDCAKFLSGKGYLAINGGGPGTMRATTEGAKAAGGHVIGVTFYPKEITNFEGRDPDNPFDEEVVTNNYLERTLKLLEMGDIYVIFNGGTGTVSEFGMAWGLARLYLGHHKPLILYGDFWNNIVKAFYDNMKVRPESHRVYQVVSTPKEAYRAIQMFDERLGKGGHIHNHKGDKAFQR